VAICRKVGIVGAGMMGAEIGLCFAMSGIDVVMKDVNTVLAERGRTRLVGVIDKAIQKGKLTIEEKDRTLNRIVITDNYESLSNVDLIVEAVLENLEVKREVFAQLDKACKADCVFSTNTSSIPITLLSTSVEPKRVTRFLGAHFFSPASVMKLVEIIPGLETDEETVVFVSDCCRKIGKTPIRVKDVTGFAVNRLLHVMWIEANRLLEEGVASPEDIDTACKLCLGQPIGPYALMDLTGNDLNLRVQEILHGAYGERFRPRPILKQKVHAKHLGRKAGRGWYKYCEQK
jgi:3-hydroxybutyryl-CoA dehydrogenase